MSNLVRICLIGDPKVGKSQVLLNFAQQTFGTYPRFDNYERDVEIYGRSIRIRGFDTSASDEYKRTRSAMYPNMEAYLLCAAVDDKQSVENLSKWMSELKSSRVHKRPIVLLLTKCDLKSDETISAETLVGQQLVNQMASKLQVADLFYCSAKTGENVEVAFKRAAELAIRSDQKGKSKCVIV